jgi:uncharacterized protein (UPF0335 family)
MKPTLEQLKAGAFDRIMQIERLQQELAQIYKEIAKLEQELKDKPVTNAVSENKETVV